MTFLYHNYDLLTPNNDFLSRKFLSCVIHNDDFSWTKQLRPGSYGRTLLLWADWLRFYCVLSAIVHVFISCFTPHMNILSSQLCEMLYSHWFNWNNILSQGRIVWICVFELFKSEVMCVYVFNLSCIHLRDVICDVVQLCQWNYCVLATFLLKVLKKWRQ